MTWPVDTRFLPERTKLDRIRLDWWKAGRKDISDGLSMIAGMVGETKTLQYIENADTEEFIAEFKKAMELAATTKIGDYSKLVELVSEELAQRALNEVK